MFNFLKDPSWQEFISGSYEVLFPSPSPSTPPLLSSGQSFEMAPEQAAPSGQGSSSTEGEFGLACLSSLVKSPFGSSLLLPPYTPLQTPSPLEGESSLESTLTDSWVSWIKYWSWLEKILIGRERVSPPIETSLSQAQVTCCLELRMALRKVFSEVCRELNGIEVRDTVDCQDHQLLPDYTSSLRGRPTRNGHNCYHIFLKGVSRAPP
jgi:hypothetical protein